MPSKTEVDLASDPAAGPKKKGPAAGLLKGDLIIRPHHGKRLTKEEQEDLPGIVDDVQISQDKVTVRLTSGKRHTWYVDNDVTYRRREYEQKSYTPHVILSTDELDGMVDDYLDGDFDYFVADCETKGTREPRPGRKGADVPALDERTNAVTWMSFARPGRLDILPLGHPGGPKQLSRFEAMPILRRLYFSELWKVNQNVKFDVLTLSKYWGKIPPGPFGDTGTLIHLLNENLSSYRLGDLMEYYFDFKYRKLAREGDPLDAFPFYDVARYVGIDAKGAQLLWEDKRGRLSRLEKLEQVFQLECDITEVLMHMRQRGALVDHKAIEQLDKYLTHELQETETEIFRKVGRQFLITSNKQLGEVLYGPKEAADGSSTGNLGLPVKRKTASGQAGVAEKDLKPLARRHPVVPLLLKFADLDKLRGTYTAGFQPHIEDDGRIRAGFNQSGTVTGRFSSSSPNLQNVPRQSDDEDANRVRGMFIAPPGFVLVVGDFGQIEYRLMADRAGPLVKDSNLLKAFIGGEDLHAITASSIFKKKISEVTKEERQVGKTVNFALIFGAQPKRLVELEVARNLKEGERFYEGYHSAYPEIEKYTLLIKSQVGRMKKPYAETLWGRRRRLPAIHSYNKWERMSAERQAVNHTIQGTAADINKAAMVRAFRRIPRWGLKDAGLIFTVHDEIALEVREEQAEKGVELLTEAMEGVKVKLRVPLVADVHYGKNWADAK